jgi:hypothetical protein
VRRPEESRLIGMSFLRTSLKRSMSKGLYKLIFEIAVHMHALLRNKCCVPFTQTPPSPERVSRPSKTDSQGTEESNIGEPCCALLQPVTAFLN